VELYEEMIDRYSHPFFLVRLADLFTLLKADTLSVNLYRKVCYSLFRLDEPGPRHTELVQYRDRGQRFGRLD
jgi:hypothetical protein